MITLDLSQLNTYFLILLPMIVAFVAGVIRQDRFPQWVNECISLALILVIATLQAILNGKLLFNDPVATFGIVTAYTTALLHTPLFQQLQSATQTHVISIGTKAPPAPPAPTIDQIVAAVEQRLAQTFRLPVSQVPVDAQPTQQMQVVRANTPPIGG